MAEQLYKGSSLSGVIIQGGNHDSGAPVQATEGRVMIAVARYQCARLKLLLRKRDGGHTSGLDGRGLIRFLGIAAHFWYSNLGVLVTGRDNMEQKPKASASQRQPNGEWGMANQR